MPMLFFLAPLFPMGLLLPMSALSFCSVRGVSVVWERDRIWHTLVLPHPSHIFPPPHVTSQSPTCFGFSVRGVVLVSKLYPSYDDAVFSWCYTSIHGMSFGWWIWLACQRSCSCVSIHGDMPVYLKDRIALQFIMECNISLITNTMQNKHIQ